MNPVNYDKLNIDKFIELNKHKNAPELYLECIKECNWAEGLKTKRITVEDRDFANRVTNYFMFLREAANAFGGFTKKYDISNPAECLQKIKESYT